MDAKWSRAINQRHPISHMTDIVIRVQNLSKCYEIYDTPRDRLKQFVLPRIRQHAGLSPKQYYREFWALKDISFEVKRGEAVGIIGRNGAGKSTLLQIITGTLAPSSGSVQVNGTVAALLELGSGFNPEFSGRENVFMAASVLGLAQDQIERRFDEIAAFADIGDFIEQPLHTYSSGMMMRLAFAVNTCVNPDILIVDEALGVGDAPFQAKCFKRLRKLIDDGASILFVSHDIETVRSICSRALWLKNGSSEMWGEAVEVAKKYERYCWVEQGIEMSSTDNLPEIIDAGQIVNQINFGPDEILKFDEVRLQNCSRSGTGAVKIKDFYIADKNGNSSNTFDYNQNVRLRYLIGLEQNIDSDFVLGIRIKDIKGNFVYSANDLEKVHRLCGNAGERFIIETELTLPLAKQDYVVLTGIFGFSEGGAFSNGAYDFTKAIIWDLIDDAAYVSIRQPSLMPAAGPVHSSINITIRKL